LDITKLRVLK